MILKGQGQQIIVNTLLKQLDAIILVGRKISVGIGRREILGMCLIDDTKQKEYVRSTLVITWPCQKIAIRKSTPHKTAASNP